jgi:group II intron reverse transcriptase/maturase
MKKQVNYVLDADIQGFFDSISHTWIRRFLEYRVADRRILRLIDKWLKAGISEDGEWSRTKVGTPQGAVISPLLANIFLHYVLDDWVVWWRKKHANGDVVIVRYADDFVMGFQYKQEADLFLQALQERLEHFSLRLHPNKTRLIEFGKYAAAKRRSRGEGKPETFTFLGFTHICSVNWKHKCFKILRQTDRKRMRETLARIGQNLKTHMHHDIDEVGYWLKRMIQGYYQYFAVPDNTRRLFLFRESVLHIWYKVLLRRSQRRSLTWAKFRPLVERWVPRPTPLHPYPEKRFCARYA